MSEDLLIRIANVFDESLGADKSLVKAGAVPEDIPGWDSLGHATMVSGLEREFGVAFEIDDVMEMENVDAIAAVVRRKLGD